MTSCVSGSFTQLLHSASYKREHPIALHLFFKFIHPLQKIKLTLKCATLHHQSQVSMFTEITIISLQLAMSNTSWVLCAWSQNPIMPQPTRFIKRSCDFPRGIEIGWYYTVLYSPRIQPHFVVDFSILLQLYLLFLILYITSAILLETSSLSTIHHYLLTIHMQG